uniref:(California timema) hypothetical protein n=1 Tax=Timema californicum TaxID=61474 RepID=A0A7R9P8X6_TIMCA|nr:unnamed protein product [Timema californicum]
MNIRSAELPSAISALPIKKRTNSWTPHGLEVDSGDTPTEKFIPRVETSEVIVEEPLRLVAAPPGNVSSVEGPGGSGEDTVIAPLSAGDGGAISSAKAKQSRSPGCSVSVSPDGGSSPELSEATSSEAPMRDTGQQISTRASSPGSILSSSGYMGSTTRLLQATKQSQWSWLPGLRTSLAVLSLAAGLGNIVRLPRVVFLNGGGAFLVVYLSISLILGIPLVFLEIGQGQLCQKGTATLWRAVPLFKGVGYVKILSSTLVSVYYPILMTLSLFYVIWIARGPLPFQECQIQGVESEGFVKGQICIQQTFLVSVDEDAMWFGVNASLLFLIWTLCMLLIFKGADSSHLSMFFVVAPVICCLIALLIDSLLREPTARGLQLLTTFNWDVLANIQVWYYATIQMFFSTHLGFGNIVTCSGGLYPNSNPLRSAVMYMVCNLLLGLLAVCVVYMWLGELELQGYSVETPQLTEMFVFTVIYDVAVTCMGATNQAWSAIAFITITCAGFATMIILVYSLLVALPLDSLGKWQWWHAAGIVSALGFLLGIPCIVPEDMQLIHILDHYVIGRMVIASTILELVGFSWIYGCKAIYTDFEFILGQKLNPVWKIVWVISPVLFTILEIWSFVSLPLDGVVGKARDPTWVYTIGWLLYTSMWVIVAAGGMYQVYHQVDYNLAQKIRSALKPSRDWGPMDPTYRHDWVQWRFQNNKTGEKDFTFRRRGTKEYARSVQRTVHTSEPAGTHYKSNSSPPSTTYSSRIRNKGPFTIESNGDIEHVCRRASANGTNKAIR